jgi:hypothetical protein
MGTQNFDLIRGKPYIFGLRGTIALPGGPNARLQFDRADVPCYRCERHRVIQTLMYWSSARLSIEGASPLLAALARKPTLSEAEGWIRGKSPTRSTKVMAPEQSTPSTFRNWPARGEPWHSPRCCLSSCWPMYRWPRTPPQEKTVCFPELCCAIPTTLPD